jgi:hypothetical protein
MENKELKFSQLKAAHYIVGGVSMKQCADLVGVSEQTVFRWLKLPLMQETIRSLRRIVIENSTNDLLRLNKLAVRTLERLMTCGNFPTECRAAVSVLDKNHLSVEFWDYAQRLQVIESRFDEK